MVLTRLSHFGEVCPLSDHSYSDPTSPSTSVGHSSQKRILQVLLGLKSSLSSPTSPQDVGVQLHVFDLPNEIIEKIFSYLPYKKIGEIRLACKRFEQIGSSILNTTFQRLQNQMLIRFQTIKGQMPRRESARRTHPLARESDIVETLHMRLTLLQMSFGKHIERKHCCFFAGDILDEVYRLLAYIKSTPNLDRAYIVTDELFDLSTMAMEYFKEHIEPRLPEITCFGSEFLGITSRFSEECSVRSPSGSGRSSEPEDEMPEHEALPQSNMVLRKRIKRIRQGMRRCNTQLAAMRRELKSCKGKLADQHKQVLEYTTRMDEYDKKFEESSRKFSTVLQELNKCKTELQYWRSKSPAQPLLCFGCGQSIGEGASHQAGVLMPGGEDAVVYVPLAAAPAPECGEKIQPSLLLGARDDSRDRWHGGGSSTRSICDPVPQQAQHPPPPQSSSAQHSPVPPPPLFQSICCSQPNLPETSQNVMSCPVAATSNSVPAARPLPISQPLVGTSAITTSMTSAAAHVLPAPLPSAISQQPYSAFHSCASSHSTDHRWYGSQEHAEDLSMSRTSKHYLDDDVDFVSSKRRGSDDDSDNCDNDDTVGRRVKERKRIKLDVF
ncbi:uncharacterized protein [Macrobrachium rosenbergii]|uniref:uncharacterized protein n=1 Tax=Macrobrachium rosenbergii TaxID=79674 RepID=UPI0034D561F5